MSRIAFWALACATLALYGVMIFWSIPVLVEAAGGLATFDMRPSGYGPAGARAFLAALDPAAVTFYRDVQLRLDTLYPALLAATLAIALYRLWADRSAMLAWALVVVAFAGALCDYLENAGIREMLRLGAEGVPDTLIARTSLASQGKAGLTTLAMVALVAGLARLGWRRWKGMA